MFYRWSTAESNNNKEEFYALPTRPSAHFLIKYTGWRRQSHAILMRRSTDDSSVGMSKII